MRQIPGVGDVTTKQWVLLMIRVIASVVEGETGFRISAQLGLDHLMCTLKDSNFKLPGGVF